MKRPFWAGSSRVNKKFAKTQHWSSDFERVFFWLWQWSSVKQTQHSQVFCLLSYSFLLSQCSTTIKTLKNPTRLKLYLFVGIYILQKKNNLKNPQSGVAINTILPIQFCSITVRANGIENLSKSQISLTGTRTFIKCSPIICYFVL